MSGIYGCWQPSCDMKEYEQDIHRLMLWNKAYGNRAEELHMGEDYCLGCYVEKLSEAAGIGAPVLQRGMKYAVIDALLFNREELLDRGRFREGLSDEELIFEFIEKFGMESLKEINGDFAGAVFDVESRKLTLFRDHMGVRPLFYYIKGNEIIFSTDIRGITAVEHVDVAVNGKWLWGNVTGTGNMGTENTEFEYIRCVKPATYMTFFVKNDELQFGQMPYWQLGATKVRLASEKAYIEKLRELITDSVKRRLDAVSGLVGAELSGGLDSGVIDILIHRLGRECVYFSWSASLEDIPMVENDERLVIEDICSQEGIKCNYGNLTINYSEDNTIAEKMQQIGIDIDWNEGTAFRYVLPPYINTLTICEASEYIGKRGAKVVFCGHGGDEGVSHRCNPYELFYHKEYLGYLKYMWSTTEGGRNRLYNTFLRCKKNLTTSRKTLLSPYEGVFGVQGLLRKEFEERYEKEEKPALSFAYDSVAYIKDGGSRNRLEVVALLGAYCGVRYLVPYLDYRVIDFAVSIPRQMYLKNQKKRYIFREAFKDVMPQSLYTLDRKDNTSWSGLDKEPVKEEDTLKQKRAIADMLDKSYWEKYLNWEAVEQWASQLPDASGEMRDKGIRMCLAKCVMIQNMFTRSRNVGEKKS